MKKIHIIGMAVLLFSTMLAALIFSQTHFSFLKIFENGINRGNDIRSIEQGWEYTINQDETRHKTALPCVLNLPPEAERLTFYNVLPADITDGDVLRLQTQLGAYQVFIDGRLMDEIGQNATEKTYLYDAATAVLFGELTKEDAGKELRIETSNIYPQYLAMLRAPLVGNHRDILMSDVIDGSGGLLIILISALFAVVFLFQYVFFRIKQQRYPILLLSAVFLTCLTIYYNTGNFFRLELWGYPSVLFPVNDFIYYCLQAFIPLIGYLILLLWNTVKLPRPLTVLICVHTVCSVAAVILQMLWLVSYIYVEVPLILLTLVCYGWLAVCIRPWRLEKQRSWMTTPVLLCVAAYLLDYYKSAGAWFPFSEEFISWFQMDLPFMIFLPIAMLLYGVAVMFGVVQWQSAEKTQLTMEARQAGAQLRMVEAQYAYMEENQRQLKQIRHDMMHHARIISQHLVQGETNEAQDYLGRMGELIAAPDLGQFCQSRTANITITYFAREAARLGISFTCEADIPQERPECGTDLCAVLANALQNALEACQRTDHPTIRLTASRAGRALLLHMENSFDGKLKRDTSGQIVTRKEEADHGYGLAGMRRTAERHGGYFKTSTEGDIFHLEVALGDLFE